MRLFVDGRDIREIVIGNLDTGEHKKYPGEPETFLKSIDHFLGSCGKTLDSLTEVHMMKGEGSATAMRASLAILNTLHFVKRVPLVAYQAPSEERDVFSRVQSGELTGERLIDYASPVYAYSPRITPTKKDQLNRKL